MGCTVLGLSDPRGKGRQLIPRALRGGERGKAVPVLTLRSGSGPLPMVYVGLCERFNEGLSK